MPAGEDILDAEHLFKAVLEKVSYCYSQKLFLIDEQFINKPYVLTSEILYMARGAKSVKCTMFSDSTAYEMSSNDHVCFAIILLLYTDTTTVFTTVASVNSVEFHSMLSGSSNISISFWTAYRFGCYCPSPALSARV